MACTLRLRDVSQFEWARRSLVTSMLAVISCAALALPDVSALNKEFTPLGGERAGNKDGSIPAWTAEAVVVGNFVPGKQLRLDSWRYKAEKPLYSIDASNVSQYAGKLSAGQMALFSQFPDYRMDVYPSHRSCNAPGFVAENTQKNVGFAQVGANGWSLKDAYVPGIPFPFPQSGIEVMWNQKMRYRGVGAFGGGFTFVSPRKGGADWLTPAAEQVLYWPWAEPGSRKLSEFGTAMSQTFVKQTEPAAMAGFNSIISDYVDKPGTDAYVYFPGQRRVRRMPTMAYDAPQAGYENQYLVDEAGLFMGAMDRFDWKLVGKKEMLVAYNSFGASDFKSDWRKVLTAEGLVPASRRYELHRVWVIEATVKAGLRHSAPKRTFYVDEDSWNLLFAEDYDAQGKLTKVREGYVIPVFEVGACDVSAFVQYNLLEGRILFDFGSVGSKGDTVYLTKPAHPAMHVNFYTPDNLRALSER